MALYPHRIEIEKLVGEVLTHVDTDGADEIMLTTASGRRIKIYHSQDCCESVQIVGTDGEWSELIGKVIIEAAEDVNNGDNSDGTWTNTDLKFRVDGATVISRWHGESNGYYSESVDIEDVTEAFNAQS